MKKYIKIWIIMSFLLASVQPGEAQIFKKIKDAITGEKQEEPTVPGEKLSGSDMQFADWELGNVDIVAFSVFEKDPTEKSFQVGTIKSDGSFSITMPENVKTIIPITAYSSQCTDAEDAQIHNPDVKVAWLRLFVMKNNKFLGTIERANPVKAAYNLNKGDVNNGNLGHYYLWVFSDGDGSIFIDCIKIRDITDGKEYTFEDVTLTNHFNLNYKKGWNMVEVHVQDNTWVGLTKHYTERTWKVVDEVSADTPWVFRPIN